jgi:predicted acetyltransferase
MTALRYATPDDFDRVSKLLFLVFHHAVDTALEDIERPLYEPDRALVVTDGDEVVGHASSYGRELTVPGGVVPAAHVTGVGVAPTHRRRGLLRSLMERQLRDLAAAGREPVAVLWASEGRIYPRFGYGSAAPRLSLSVDTAAVGTSTLAASGPVSSADPAAGGRTVLADPPAVRVTLAKVFDQVRAERPGWSGRDERWWQYLLADLESRRDGATERRAVLHEGPDGVVDGYALYRVKSEWNDGGPAGEVRAQEVVAADAEAYRTLWGFLMSVDLTRRLTYEFGTPDEPLQHLVAEPRRLGATFGDGLWVRVLDVPAALSARRYATPVDVVLAVTDAHLPGNGGRWRLSGSPAGAACAPTAEEADLALDVTDLGAVYLGGVSLSALAAAGRVRELRPGALTAADVAFRWHRAPGSIEVF